MSPSLPGPRPASPRSRWFLPAALVALAAGLATWAVLHVQARGPRLLNQPNRAREVHPFSTRPDPRFAPLPLEREEHGE